MGFLVIFQNVEAKLLRHHSFSIWTSSDYSKPMPSQNFEYRSCTILPHNIVRLTYIFIVWTGLRAAIKIINDNVCIYSVQFGPVGRQSER